MTEDHDRAREPGDIRRGHRDLRKEQHAGSVAVVILLLQFAW